MHKVRLATSLLCLVAIRTWAATPICQPIQFRSEPYPATIPEESMSLDELNRLVKAEKDPRAMNELGRRYGTGDGARKNSRKSFDYYRRAAEHGLPIAQVNLAYMYLHGEGTRKDLQLAFQWAKRASDMGHFQGHQFLGYMLGTGTGVAENKKEAAYCYLLAARQGSVDAQYSLAEIYSRGLGIPTNHEKAQVWLKRAGEAERTRKLWVDHSPIAGMPDDFEYPFVPLEDVAFDTLIETEDYTIRALVPNVDMVEGSWHRFAERKEPRTTLLSGNRGRVDRLELQVTPKGKLQPRETLVAAGSRLYPEASFVPITGRRECVGLQGTEPVKLEEVFADVVICVRPRDGTLFELSATHGRAFRSHMEDHTRAAYDELLAQFTRAALDGLSLK